MLSCFNVSTLAAEDAALKRPEEGEFVRDTADMIDRVDYHHIRKVCQSLLDDKKTPIIVVTIESMAQHGGQGETIETFAMQLFNKWEIGHAKLGQVHWNTGILLLISKQDRKARIELGAGWGRSENALCRTIMDDHIIYHFKQGKFSNGIVAGVEALDKMGRKLEIPTQPRPWWHYALIVGLIVLAVSSAVSLKRSGASGWAWALWGLVFSVLGYLLYQMLTSQGGSSGSFGGGSSGGGGATGSW